MMNRLISILSILAALAFCARDAWAVSVTGADWRIHYNLPDQDTSYGTFSDDEYAIREALLVRIRALQSGDQATLTTFTFSGDTTELGAAGPIINAIDTALDRGAHVRMVVDNDVDTGQVYGGTNSLITLAARPSNPLTLVQDDDANWWGIMHNKLGLFRYGPTSQWVFVTSWNFTGGASSYQWNIALEAQNADLYAAYSNEMAELLAGRFHDHASKSHDHDNAAFELPGSWALSRARFGPSIGRFDGQTNMATAITNVIAGADDEIFFALNRLTLGEIATQLVAAADRGVEIHGVMPKSDTDPGETSQPLYDYLSNPASYAGANTVQFHTAFAKADYSQADTGESDLVHAKYMVIDPFGAAPVVIHGSPNWTYSGLMDDDANDENLLILRHRAIASIFYAHFKRVTGALPGRTDNWLEIERENGRSVVNFWLTDTNTYALDHIPTLTSPTWTPLTTGVTGTAGRISHVTNAVKGFYRGRRE